MEGQVLELSYEEDQNELSILVKERTEELTEEEPVNENSVDLADIAGDPIVVPIPDPTVEDPPTLEADSEIVRVRIPRLSDRD